MSVIQEDTFECVIRLITNGNNPVALDFASGTNPGGGWRSKKHFGCQEESLCKRSNLGLLLEKKKYPIPNDGLYYIPMVIINKDIELKSIKPIKCAIITSELRAICEHNSNYLQTRIRNLYDVAISNNHDIIVLGAWGCGAFSESLDDSDILSK
jgi:uncharacterized protein (TIGR02452 family)